MNISFFGLGYVGCVGMGCLAQNGHKVIGIDISSEKIKKINEGMPTIVEAGIDEIIRDLNYIYQTAEEIGEALKEKNGFHIIVIRSTVFPGTNKAVGKIIEEMSGKTRNVHFAVVSNPEFLREGTAVNDYMNPPLTVIGTD